MKEKNELVVKTHSASPARRSPLDLYLSEISRYPLLDPEEEYKLAVEHFEKGDRAAAHRLVTANLRIVVKIANGFRQARSNLLDLIQEGNAGLMQAVKKFNPYKGVKLTTYAAWWIKAYILKYIMDNRSQVRIGTTAAQRRLFYNLHKEAQKLLAEYDRVDTKLLAESMDVKERDVIEMQQRMSGSDISIDASVIAADGSDKGPRSDLIIDSAPLADEFLASEQVKKVFEEHLEEFSSQLKERDLEFYRARILAEEPLTLQELGDRYGISRERARQIEAKIVEKLRAFVLEKGVIDIEVGAR